MALSDEVKQKIRACKEKQLTKLNLSDCGLTQIPGEVSQLTQLKKLAPQKNLWVKAVRLLGALK